MFYVYILYSETLKKFYTGTTDNVEKRLVEHNSMKYPDAYSVKGIPWNLYLKIECESSTQAYNIEKFIKQMKSSKFIQSLKEVPLKLESILSKF
jgi:putative endonuclease